MTDWINHQQEEAIVTEERIEPQKNQNTSEDSVYECEEELSNGNGLEVYKAPTENDLINQFAEARKATLTLQQIKQQGEEGAEQLHYIVLKEIAEALKVQNYIAGIAKKVLGGITPKEDDPMILNTMLVFESNISGAIPSEGMVKAVIEQALEKAFGKTFAIVTLSNKESAFGLEAKITDTKGIIAIPAEYKKPGNLNNGERTQLLQNIQAYLAILKSLYGRMKQATTATLGAKQMDLPNVPDFQPSDGRK